MTKIKTAECKAFITKTLSESNNKELADELLENLKHTDKKAQNFWWRSEKFKIKNLDQILNQNAWFVEFDEEDLDICNRPKDLETIIGGTLRGFGYNGSVAAEFVIITDSSDENIIAWALHTD